MTPWRTRPDLLRCGVLALTAAVLWVGFTGKWSSEAWQTPAAYSVDALETLARFQVAHEQGTGLLFSPQVGRLGAPTGADWTAYPLPDFPWYWTAGQLVGWLGLIPASNAMLLLAHVVAVLAFFGCARLLGQRPLFAAGAALLFGFSFSIFHRGLSHHSFALAYSVPCAWLIVWLVAGSRQILRRPAGFSVVAALGAVLGFSNPYFIYLFGVLLLTALGWQLLRHRRRANLLAGLTAGIACVGVFVATNLPFLRASASGLYGRGAAEPSFYGLRLLDLIAPPANHHLALFGEWGRAYAAARASGEPFAPYLGVVGAVSLLALLLCAVVSLARRRRGPALALWAAGVLAFALAGGVNSWLAALGLDQFRATNRYSIHLLALALFFAASAATHLTRAWTTTARVSLLVGVVAFGLWDSVPRRDSSEHQRELRGTVEFDARIGRAFESALSTRAVFQLPVAVFPEQGPIGGMGDYELLRPYLWTRTVRFSYGGLATAPERQWQLNVARLPAPDLVEALERAGFAALHINRDAFPDRAAALAASLDGLGRKPLIDDGAYLVYSLTPAAATFAPGIDDPLFYTRWDGLVPRRREPSVLVGEGWYGMERDGTRAWRWAGSRPQLALYNDFDRPRNVRLRATFVAAAPGLLTVECNGERFSSYFRANSPQTLELSFTLQPHMNFAQFTFDAPPRRAGPQDPRLITFSMADLTATFGDPYRR